ncbi:MAG: hypothetical protein JWR01_1839 [Subtercola sp.]|nr:hypothetical protein [Subtercola sp.]
MVMDQAPRVTERSDAARNRVRLLGVARDIIGRVGAEGLTMDRLAAEGSVGKGTIFRRFGSRAGLFQQILDDVEHGFHDRCQNGPPPLEPGAEPRERLVAFGRARIDTLALQREVLAAAAEQPAAERSEVPAREAATLRVEELLRQGGSTADVPVLAFMLLAAMDSMILLPEMNDAGQAVSRLADGWEDLVRQLI